MLKKKVSFILNGKAMTKEVSVNHTLLDFLRDDLHFTGTKCGCGGGECGTCTVLIDGRPVNSCLMLATDAEGKDILTIEGLGGEKALHPLQKAFVAYGAIQCGYCTPGMLMSAAALLYENPDPTEDEIRTAIAGNLCRCGDYSAIAKAVKEAAEVLRRAKEEAISHE